MKKYWIILLLIFVVFTIMDCCLVSLPPIFFTNNFSLGDYYSGGQLFVDILLIPIASIGFYVTYKEFQKGQDKADLSLYWENSNSKDDQTISIQCKKDEEGRYYLDSILQIALINKGNIIPSQYMVVLETNWNINNSNIRPIIVTPLSSEHWKGEGSQGKYSLIFYSHSKFPTYPKNPQTLCSIVREKNPYLQPTFIENTSIAYTIYSDKSNKVTGTLIIEIVDYDDKEYPIFTPSGGQ